MAMITAGNCIGVLYRSGNQVRIHNGRFRLARFGSQFRTTFDTNNLPSEITIERWSLRPNGTPVLDTNVRISNLLQVARTPDLPPTDPLRCQAARNNTLSPNVLPGLCVGIWFRNPNGTFDINNGRYLYWVDLLGMPHCEIPPNVPAPLVAYYHFVIGRDAQNRPFLRPVLERRPGVLRVMRTA